MNLIYDNETWRSQFYLSIVCRLFSATNTVIAKTIIAVKQQIISLCCCFFRLLSKIT